MTVAATNIQSTYRLLTLLCLSIFVFALRFSVRLFRARVYLSLSLTLSGSVRRCLSIHLAYPPSLFRALFLASYALTASASSEHLAFAPSLYLAPPMSPCSFPRVVRSDRARKLAVPGISSVFISRSFPRVVRSHREHKLRAFGIPSVSIFHVSYFPAVSLLAPSALPARVSSKSACRSSLSCSHLSFFFPNPLCTC